MKRILIYADAGVSPSSFKQTIMSLQKEVNPCRYILQACDADQLLKTDWEKNTALLVIPGGRDLPYHRKLFPQATKRIYNFVASGGRYLGLCAGAYFGAREILFEKGGDLEVCGFRDLGFFPGRAIGPAYGNGKFRYECDAGAEAASILWKIEGKKIACRTFFKGGCLFETPSLFPHVEVVGVYADLPHTPAAAVSCRVGKGSAILSGVHIEYSTQHGWDVSGFNQKLADLLLESEELRQFCFRCLLFKLKI